MIKNYALMGLALCTAMPADLHASDSGIEEIVVIEKHSKRVFYIEDELSVLPDTSQLLKKMPGGNVNGNGPLTGIPQYRGMFGPRIGVSVNGALIAPAGPNWMDPPLSYAAPSQLVKLEVYRGIAPVSVVQESIGGAIVSDTKLGDFTESDAWDVAGRFSVSGQSAQNASLINVMTSVANNSHTLSIAAMSEQGDDAEFPSGLILPTSYARDRAEAAYGYQIGRHTFAARATRNETGNAGTPSLPMDIDYFNGDLYNLNYSYSGNEWDIESQLYASNLVHGMSNYHLRSVPSSRSAWRQNTTDVDNRGLGFKAIRDDSTGTWRMGVDYFKESHNSLINNPNNPIFFVVGFNEASRSVAGLFIEREHRFSVFVAEFGVRVNAVDSSSGVVDGTPARLMLPATRLKEDFNNADRASSDTNIDLVAKIWFQYNDQLSLYVGAAQKSRSASFVERNLWLPLQATGGLADGFTYTGNLGLNPETSTEFEFGFDWDESDFKMSPRVYIRDINDFIQGTPSSNADAIAFVRMMNVNAGAQQSMPLQFNNVDARIYGFDMDWRYALSDQWALSGLLNYVRGKRKDVEDNLYRLAPPNASVQLSYRSNALTANAEVVAYDDQRRVSATNNELETEGYALVNLSASYVVNESLRLAVGANNVLDNDYLDHLAGYNRASNPDILLGDRLPGIGRNVFLRADLTW